MKRVFLIISGLLMTFTLILMAYGDSAKPVPLEVVPVLNGVKGQRPRSDYFDINAKPGAKQQLKVMLVNRSSKVQNLQLTINPATTSSNPLISYGTHNTGDKQRFSLPQFLRFPNGKTGRNINIPGKHQTAVIMKLQIPKGKKFQSFSGTILGGLNVVPKLSWNNAGLDSRYGYSVAVQLHCGLGEPSADLKLDKATTLPGNNSNFLQVKMSNPNPRVLGDAKIEASVYQKGQKGIVVKKTTNNAQVAPDSSFSYFIPKPSKEYSPGWYHLNIKVVSKDPQFKNRKSWNFKQSFRIERQNLPAKSPQNYMWVVLAAVVLLGVGMCGFIFFKERFT